MTAFLVHKTTEPNACEQREATAAYVGSLAGDLAQLARRHGLDTLGYLLDMARLEAESAAHGRSHGGKPD